MNKNLTLLIVLTVCVLLAKNIPPAAKKSPKHVPLQTSSANANDYKQEAPLNITPFSSLYKRSIRFNSYVNVVRCREA